MDESELLAALHAAREIADEHYAAAWDQRMDSHDDAPNEAWNRIDGMHKHIYGAIRALVGRQG